MTIRCRDHMVDLRESDLGFHKECRITNYCPGRARHWRIAPGTIGYRTPVCVWCGSPNPKPLTENEWHHLIYWWNERERKGWKILAEAIAAWEKAKKDS